MTLPILIIQYKTRIKLYQIYTVIDYGNKGIGLMTFATLKEVLDKARSEKYAVGAFNINNIETITAIVEAAMNERSPVILAVSPNAIRFLGLEYIYQIASIAAMKSRVPTVLHLDHGTSFEQCIQCIRYGFSSIMFDGSKLPLNENISKTKEIVKIAHSVGVSVEAELGSIAGNEDSISIEERNIKLTNPDEARLFVLETGVDALAVAIGTSHGAYKFKGDINLDFARLKEIEELIKKPIVLHGASSVPKDILKKAIQYGAKLDGATGIPDDEIKKAIDLGVTKINIATDIRLTFTAIMRQELSEHPSELDPINIFDPVKNAIKDIAIRKMKLFGSSGKVP